MAQIEPAIACGEGGGDRCVGVKEISGEKCPSICIEGESAEVEVDTWAPRRCCKWPAVTVCEIGSRRCSWEAT